MSESSKHTPGPWRIYGLTNVIVGPHAEDECGLTIAEVKPWRGTQTTRANAALITAAPDLLAALEDILAATNLKGSGHPLETKALDAIRKAKGE